MAKAYPPADSADTERQELRERQLAVLRSTYPGWVIDYSRDGAGVEWWTAKLRNPTTERMRAIGVFENLQRFDVIEMASVLSYQAALVHSCRTQFWAT